MPLSEDDQRRLDEIERALQRDDPKFAAGRSLERLRQRRLVAAGAVVLIGMVLLVAGLAVTQAAPVVSVIISVGRVLTMILAVPRCSSGGTAAKPAWCSSRSPARRARGGSGICS
jgi:hypothetical protein